MKRQRPKRYAIDWQKNWSNLSGCFPYLWASLLTVGIGFWLTKSPFSTTQCQLLLGNSPYKLDTQAKSNCYILNLQEGQRIKISADSPIKLIYPDQTSEKILPKNDYTKLIEKPGEYRFNFPPKSTNNTSYLATLQVIEPENLISTPQLSPNLPERPLVPAEISPSFLAYNIPDNPPFKPNDKLQNIVEQIVALAQKRKLPTEKLSISLVALDSPQCCAYAAYNDQELRYPASVVKLFWLIELFSQYQSQGITRQEIPASDWNMIRKTIEKSDNETASEMLDKITNTTSKSKPLSLEELRDWSNQRYGVNYFFKAANYPDFNISQKVFPISDTVTEPQGPDLQIRQIYGSKSPPVRNHVSTYSVARLLYEISQKQAVSPEYSEEALKLLRRNLDSRVWKKEPFNPIGGFFGEYLPINSKFYAKMGWTFKNRNDAAIITPGNGQNRYILVVFGDDPAYYQDKEFFPLLSRQVYQQIRSQD